MTTNPNQHERIRADLKAYIDGELSPLAQFFVARHLRGCPSCREELTHMQTLSTEIRESEPETAPLSSNLRASILDNAPTTESASEEEFDPRPRRVARKKMILALGGASILAVIAFNSLIMRGAGGGNADFAVSPNAGVTSSTTSAGSASSSAGHDSGVVAGAANPAKLRSSGDVNGDFKTQNGYAANSLSSDGHVKDQIFRRDGAALSTAPSAAQQNVRVLDRATSSTEPDFSVTLSGPVVPTTRAVHREGSLAVGVQNAESASEDATSIIKNAGGFVANTSLETGGGQKRTAVLDCRVPVAQFEVVVKKIGALGTVRSKSLNGQDITAQIARSGARRQTLAQELAIAQTRLAEKEKSRKPNANDLYQLRAEVRTIRIQASQARAALETLQKYGSLSSLYVSLQDGLPATATPRAAGWFDSLSPTSQAAWTSFLSNARVPLQLLLWILAYSPFWVPALIIWRKYGRKWLTE